MRAQITERVPPGVVYTTFHHQSSGTNIVTTENSDWATNCPEYKVTAVQVMPAAEPGVRRAAGQGADTHPAAGR
jgi:formate dehydrogenase major subunit